MTTDGLLRYNGHAFWDCETWMYPTLLAWHPTIARSLLEYRVERLPLARAKAKTYKPPYAGAMFPWESAVSGAIEGAPAAVSRELSPVPDGECLLQSMIQAQEDDEEEEESKGGTAAAAEGASSAAHGAPGTARTPLDRAPSKKRPISSAISTGVPGVVGMAKRRLGIVGFSSANARPVHLQAS